MEAEAGVEAEAKAEAEAGVEAGVEALRKKSWRWSPMINCKATERVLVRRNRLLVEATVLPEAGWMMEAVKMVEMVMVKMVEVVAVAWMMV